MVTQQHLFWSQSLPMFGATHSYRPAAASEHRSNAQHHPLPEKHVRVACKVALKESISRERSCDRSSADGLHIIGPARSDSQRKIRRKRLQHDSTNDFVPCERFSCWPCRQHEMLLKVMKAMCATNHPPPLQPPTCRPQHSTPHQPPMLPVRDFLVLTMCTLLRRIVGAHPTGCIAV
jgi:hypothetical protein